MDAFAFDINPMSKSMKTNRDIGVMNYNEFFNYYSWHLIELAISRFTWENIPLHIPTEIIERTLITKGMGAFKDEKEGGLQFYAAASGGVLDKYGYPTKINLYPAYGTGTTKIYDVGDGCIPVYNSRLQNNDLWIINYYAKQLANIKATQFTNIKAQKTPNIVATDYKNKLSLINAYQQLETGAQAIFVDKNFSPDSLSVYNTTAPIVFDKLQTQLENLWNEALTRLGINSPAVEKRERVNVDEVNANNVEIQQNLVLRLKMRERAVEQMNEEFKDILDKPIEVKVTSNILREEDLSIEREEEDARLPK